MDERPHALVGDEEQHLVERGVGVDVPRAGGQLLHPPAHVAEEGLGVGVTLGVGSRFEVAQVVVDRELHIHVEHAAAGEQERHIGDGPADDARLLAVGDALDHAGEA